MSENRLASDAQRSHNFIKRYNSSTMPPISTAHTEHGDKVSAGTVAPHRDFLRVEVVLFRVPISGFCNADT